MGQAIGGSLPPAIGVAVSPVAIIAVVLMLTTERATPWANGQPICWPRSKTGWPGTTR